MWCSNFSLLNEMLHTHEGTTPKTLRPSHPWEQKKKKVERWKKMSAQHSEGSRETLLKPVLLKLKVQRWSIYFPKLFRDFIYAIRHTFQKVTSALFLVYPYLVIHLHRTHSKISFSFNRMYNAIKKKKKSCFLLWT